MNLEYFLISTITNLLTSIGLIYSFSKISNLKFKFNYKNILLIIIIDILLCINNYYNIDSLRILFAFILTFLTELLVFKNNAKETFIIVVILTLLSIIIEFITSPIVAIFSNDINILNEFVIVKMIFSILNTLLLVFVTSNKYTIKFFTKLKNVINSFINFYSLSMLLICSLNIFMLTYAYNLRNGKILAVIIICAIIIFIFIRTIINDKHNNNILKHQNKILKDEYKAYSHTIDQCRELKHNLKNELFTIKVNLPKEEQNMINSLIAKYNTNYEWINKLNDIPEGLQGLIFLKINEAKKKRIKIFLNMDNNKIIKPSENDFLELSTILGILIDNAIEASEVAKSKIILINIISNKNSLKIEIINRFNNRIDIKNIGKKNYSTKEKKSGLGINYITKLNKPNMKVNFKIIDNIYTSNIIYQNKNKANQ